MAGEIRSFRDLIAWQKAMQLCHQVYSISARFPPAERFGLTAQLRRAAVSIPSNVAEGYGRGHQQDYVRFLRIARGSLYELETQLTLAVRLEFATSDVAASTADLTRKLDRILCALINAVGKSTPLEEHE
jgi:four helix bundle protein